MSPLSPAVARFWEGVGHVLGVALVYGAFVTVVVAILPAPVAFTVLLLERLARLDRRA
jgi:hypothetical protein